MSVDPITLEVIRNRLMSASRDVRRTVERAAYSPILHEVVDFSCGILDSNANVLAETPGLPSFLGSLGYAVESTYNTIGKENVNDSDVIVCNDPYNGGGTHCPDVVMLSPTFYKSDIKGWAVFRGHTVDMGGIHAGGWYPDTTSIYQEGFRLPPVKIIKRGELDESVFRLIGNNSRAPDAVLGDIRAMIAAVQKGSQRFYELYDKYGISVISSGIKEILKQGEKTSQEAISKIPNGKYSESIFLDGDGNDDNPLDEKVLLKVTVEVFDDRIRIDFTGTDKQCDGPMNVPRASTICSARYGFKIVTSPRTPTNEGLFKPLDIEIPENSLLNPDPPAACAMWPTPTTSIPDLILKALAPAISEKVRAGHFGDSMANFLYGTDPRTGEYYVCAEGDAGGHGGKPFEDGESALFSMNLGDTYNVPVEVAELRYPWRVEKVEFLQDSCGGGKYRGGLGVRRDYRILDHEASLTVTTDRVKYTPPWGLFGGKEGGTSITKIFRKNGKEETWRKISDLSLDEEDICSFQTGGGGGYGNPLERDPEKVLSDVKNEYISIEEAKETYGVIIDQESMMVDKESTNNLRNEMGKEKKTE